MGEITYPCAYRTNVVLKMNAYEIDRGVDRCLQRSPALLAEVELQPMRYYQEVMDAWIDGYELGISFKQRDACHNTAHEWAEWHKFHSSSRAKFFRECDRCSAKEVSYGYS